MKTVSRILERLNSLDSFDKTELMHRLGVEPLRSAGQRWMPPAGGFGVGFGLGVGVGMLMSPKAGKELREDIGSMISGWFSSSDSETTETSPERSSSPDQTSDSTDTRFSVSEHSTARA